MTLRRAGALLLVLLTACTSTARVAPRIASPGYSPDTRWYDVDVIEPSAVPTKPVSMAGEEFQHALAQLARQIRLKAPPPEAARSALEAGLEEEWLAEVYRGRVLTLVPLERGALAPLEEEALRRDYLRWCEKRGGGDCLALLEDQPFLRTDDRRTLALAMALGSVLDESRQALTRELLDVRTVVATLVWAAALYLMMWMVPEPVTKGVAAVLTVVLVGWLGVDTTWGLMDGWARLAHSAREARTFTQLRMAGEQYARVMGEHAARVLVMAATTALGSKTADVARWVRGLPGYARAVVQAEAQGTRMSALAAVETVAAAPEGRFTIWMQSRPGAASTAPASSSTSITIATRHLGGNKCCSPTASAGTCRAADRPAKSPPRTRWGMNYKQPRTGPRRNGGHTASR